MAAKSTRSKAKTKKNAASKPTKEVTEATRLRKNRMWSSVLFIVGVLIIFLTYITGESLWEALHLGLWGLFGISAVLLAPIIIYVAVMLALDRSKSAVITKVVQGSLLLLLVSPVFEIIYCLVHKLPVYKVPGKETFKFGELLGVLFDRGMAKQGGGALSAFIGGALVKLCGTAGALIIIILLALLFVMLLTNITFVDVARFFAGIGRRIGEAFRENGRERDAVAAQRAEEEKEQKKEQEAEDKKRKDKDRRIDVAKFIPDDEPEVSIDSSEPKPEKKPEEPSKPEKPKKKSFFDDFPQDKPAEEKKEPEPEQPQTPADSSYDSRDIYIRSAVTPVSQTIDDESSAPKLKDTAKSVKSDIVNPIYVDEDGQTSLIESDSASKPVYDVPPIDLLNMPRKTVSLEDSQSEIRQNSETLVETLRSFGVTTRLIDTHRGPSVTRYELQPAAGVKVSKITSLADDIALNLAAEGVRIEAPIPGKAAVGIELANKSRETVCIRELIDSEEFRNQKSKLGFPVGKDIEGKIITGDISKMPHLLIAGTTGSGKSVFTNSIIMSILYNASPDEVKLILVDPKQVEFPIYNGIPHLLIPVVTEARKSAGALGWAVTEMMKRYKIFSDNGVKDLNDYNEYVKDKDGLAPLPKIVIVVDELADLMMAAPKEVEESICRIAQLARAAGMHLVIATQSPRADIVTGLIKANIPSRVALKVSNQVDSRVILDEGGAEKLLGNGDLLYKPVGVGKPVRIQGSYVATDEIRRVVDYLKAETAAQYDDDVASEVEKHIPVQKGEKGGSMSSGDDAPQDSGQNDMVERAIEAIIREGVASTTFLQRRLKLGYARAARVMEEIESMGIIGPANGAKPREILMTKEQWLERRASMGGDTPTDVVLGSDD